jgi:uncharacterized protein
MRKIKFYSLWFVLINVIVFGIQSMYKGFTEMFVLNQLAYSQSWRFLTSIFLHGSMVHLMYNMFALLFFGFALEKTIGSKKFLLVYFGSGIVANIISVNFYPSSLGASGAIMGIIGALAMLRPMMMVWAFGLILPMFIAAILWIIGDILGIFMPSNVGNIAHLSGIGIGLIVGIWFRKRLKKKKPNNRIELPNFYMKNWEDRNMR